MFVTQSEDTDLLRASSTEAIPPALSFGVSEVVDTSGVTSIAQGLGLNYPELI